MAGLSSSFKDLAEHFANLIQQVTHLLEILKNRGQTPLSFWESFQAIQSAQLYGGELPTTPDTDHDSYLFMHMLLSCQLHLRFVLSRLYCVILL